MQPPVDTWSSPTTVWAAGLTQRAPGGRTSGRARRRRAAPTSQIELVAAQVPITTLITASAATAAGTLVPELADALTADPTAVPLALGGGSVMDLVRLTALTAPATRRSPTG